jgi:hypothetical protein
MTIATTYTKIVSLVSGTSGIGLCKEELTRQLSEADLPHAQVKVGPATWNEHAVGLYRQVRSYAITVYVRPVAEGVEPDEGYKACLTPLYNLGRTFVTNWTLDGEEDQIGEGDRPTFDDGGVQVLNFGGIDYYGFAITLLLTEKAN